MTDSVKPLVDRIVSQPLEFKKAVQEDSYNVGGEGSSYIMISSSTQKQQQEAKEGDEHQLEHGHYQGTAATATASRKEKVAKPSSFAEALKMYTTKKSAANAVESRPNRSSQLPITASHVTPSGKLSIGLSNELLLSDDDYHGSSTEDEEHPIVSLLENKVTPDSNEMSGSGSSASSSSSATSAPVSSSDDDEEDEDEDEVFHEAREFVQPSLGLAAPAEQPGNVDEEDESDDTSFHASSASSEDENDEDDEDISAEEKEDLKLEATEHAASSCQFNGVSSSSTAAASESNPEEKENDEEEEEEEELKHKSPQPPSPTPPTTLQDKSSFYQFNESINDHGSNKPQRIVKNWGSKLTQLKPRGLLNHGVTCYTNAAVQAMVHIPAIQHYLFQLLRGNFKDTVKPNSVSILLAETTMRMWSSDSTKNTYINPDKLINALEDINCMMSAWNQEDSHEYFMSLMSRLQEDSVPKGHKMTESIIYDVFGGLLQQSVKCSNCGEISTTEQPIYDLSLHLKGRKTTDQDQNSVGQDNSTDSSVDQQLSSKRRFSIEKSIRDFFNPELIKRVDNKEGYTCEKCKKVTNALKSNKIIRAPETLVVHLKKFRFNGTSSSKMKQAVSYPMFLDLTEYCHESISFLPVRYQLISVVVHEGRSLSSGHYIAHCKQPDGSWATYDDEYINKISEKQLLKEPNAYYLVYTRLTPKSVPLSSQSSIKSADLGIPQLQRPPSSHSSSQNNSKRKNKKKNKKRRISP
ncbi:Ubp10 [Kluyveromyces lactis]|nr:Ubp10 [Kluyveromyces lactis]